MQGSNGASHGPVRAKSGKGEEGEQEKAKSIRHAILFRDYMPPSTTDFLAEMLELYLPFSALPLLEQHMLNVVEKADGACKQHFFIVYLGSFSLFPWAAECGVQ